jgi:hypothetical protein
MKEIILYGICDINGTSFLHSCFPVQSLSPLRWESIDTDTVLILDKDNLFPKDKPRKFKLVPVEDDNLKGD